MKTAQSHPTTARLDRPSGNLQQRRTAIATATASVRTPPVEACLAELLDHLGIARAHFAGRSLADLQDFIAEDPKRIASLTLVCPTVLNPRSLSPLGARLLVVSGDHGLGARRVRAVLPDLPEAGAVVLEDYAGLTWADLAADRGGHIDAAMRELHARHEALATANLREQEGDIADISFRVHGAGPPLVLLPLDLSPGQWEPLIPALSARYCTITLGGALFSSVASLEERGRSGYMAVVRGLLDALAIHPGESVLEVGCGSGVIMRELARPGGRIGIVVRAVDMPFWANLPLDPALKAKVDAPNVIGGGVAPKGVADASLYRRLAALGLTGLKCFPQLVPVVPGSERIERYQQQILAALTPAETATWHEAVAAAERDGTFFIAQPHHCAVATKPG